MSKHLGAGRQLYRCHQKVLAVEIPKKIIIVDAPGPSIGTTHLDALLYENGKRPVSTVWPEVFVAIKDTRFGLDERSGA